MIEAVNQADPAVESVMSKEEFIAYVAAQKLQRDDPEEYARLQGIAQVNATYDEMAAKAQEVGASETLADIEEFRAVELAKLVPAVKTPDEALLTASVLKTTAATVAAPIWSAVQFVEPTRDGEPWCTREQAEEMLIRAAQVVMRGPAGIKPTKHELVFDAAKSTLTLKLA